MKVETLLDHLLTLAVDSWPWERHQIWRGKMPGVQEATLPPPQLHHRKEGKDWGQEEKGMTEDEMVGWHH